MDGPIRRYPRVNKLCLVAYVNRDGTEPRAVLAGIPGVELVELPEPAICCGSAGIYNLVQPDTAHDLGERKAGLIDALKPDVVVTGNPGCLLQLRAALSRNGAGIPVVHTMQVLDASIEGGLKA